MAEMTNEEAGLLDGHFSNPDGNIFVITTPSQIDRGALMSRYSRSTKSMRRVFLDEFLSNPERGRKFYERVLIEYGDDSVAELGTAQVAMEGISNIAIQKIEDRRIGMSFLEKSSRYVSWASKSGGQFAYYRGSDVMESRHEKKYEDACNFSFETYVKSMPEVDKYLREKFPIDEFPFRDSDSLVEKPFSKLTVQSDIKSAERAYNNAARSMALDVLRGLLPAAALSNVGITGNGRSFEYLINVLKSSHLSEEQDVGGRLTAELQQTMGPFIKRTQEKYGHQLEEYLTKVRLACEPAFQKTIPIPKGRVKLVQYESQKIALDMIVASLMYERSGIPLENILKFVKSSVTTEQKHDMIRAVVGLRKGRRQRPPRAFEMTSYVFDMVNNYGMFRDMHRHRILTMQRQLLSTRHGYDMPPELTESGCAEEFAQCMQKTNETYLAMAETDAEMAQYVVNFAYRYPYMIRVNLRELCHLVELRTIPQGHRDYRMVAYRMYEHVRNVHPDLSSIIKFVDVNAYVMGRIEAEKRTISKIGSV